ncbi:MAG: hypothetical protein LBV49_13755, partial [Azonexus sp.]|nr:hypothetical protein [Azonexus sp.]
TYDEVIGQNGVNDANYNDYLLDQVKPGQLNVYTIHAEVEGIVRRELFEQLLCKARARGIRFKPLGELLPPPPLPRGALVAERLAGREGWLATQGAERR